MTSVRRVKKGPGRRPQSAKRQKFMELRARGWNISAAAREVGVSRSSGKNWSRGQKVYRSVVVGFVPPLDRLDVRQIHARYLSQDERIEIADLRQAGMSMRAVALRVGRSPVTISRELRRNAVVGGGRVSAVRCTPSCHGPAWPQPSPPSRKQRRARPDRHRAPGSPVEPTTGQPTPTPTVSG